MMWRLDRWLIERIAEPAAWWASRRIGLDSFNAARFFCITFVAAIATNANNERTALFIGMAAAALVWFLPLRLWVLWRLEQDVSKRGMANPEKHENYQVAFRCFMLVINIPTAMLVLWEMRVSLLGVGNIAFLAHAYLSARDKPPPQPQTYAVPHAAPEAA